MLFKDIVGHGDIAEKLRLGVHSGRVAHAQLFDGPEGSGAVDLVLAYAQYLHCENQGEDDSCGACSACRSYASFQHPDLHFSFPFFKADGADRATSIPFQGKFRELLMTGPHFGLEDWLSALGADRKQLFISVHEAAEIGRKLGLKSFKGGHKILIFWLPEMMRVDTANKMLKLIEEPTDGTVLLFISERYDRLLATIRSRVQRVRVPRLRDEEAAAGLAQFTDLSIEKCTEIARLAEGNMAAAKRLASAAIDAPDADLFIGWMRACWAQDMEEMVSLGDAFSATGREGMKRFLKYALHMVRQCIIGNYGAMDLVRLTERELAFCQKFSPFIHHGNVEEIQSLIERAHRDVSGNVNGKLVFLDMSVQTHIQLRKSTTELAS